MSGEQLDLLNRRFYITVTLEPISIAAINNGLAVTAGMSVTELDEGTSDMLRQAVKFLEAPNGEG